MTDREHIAKIAADAIAREGGFKSRTFPEKLARAALDRIAEGRNAS